MLLTCVGCRYPPSPPLYEQVGWGIGENGDPPSTVCTSTAETGVEGWECSDGGASNVCQDVAVSIGPFELVEHRTRCCFCFAAVTWFVMVHLLSVHKSEQPASNNCSLPSVSMELVLACTWKQFFFSDKARDAILSSTNFTRDPRRREGSSNGCG